LLNPFHGNGRKSYDVARAGLGNLPQVGLDHRGYLGVPARGVTVAQHDDGTAAPRYLY